MTALFILIAVQIATTIAFALFAWRRFDALEHEIVRLRELVGELLGERVEKRAPASATATQAERAHAPRQTKLVAAGASSSGADTAEKTIMRADDSALKTARDIQTPRTRAAPRLIAIDGADAPPGPWRRPRAPSREMMRGAFTLLAIASPALGLPFGVPVLALMLAGIGLALLCLFVALRKDWNTPGWSAALGAGAWAFAALTHAAAGHDAFLYSGALALAGLAGLVQAGLRRRSWSGATLTLLMAGADLALAQATSFIGPAGLSYGVLVAAAAALGALRLRRDALHVAAFGAAGAALLVHAGQPDAFMWFTPLAAWAGALFLGVAAVRVPALGARGALLAATGVTAPLFAAASLAASQQGLTAPVAAASAFAGLAALFAGLLAIAARRARAIRALGLTAWVLVAGLSVAAGAAFALALPAPLPAPAFAILGLAFIGADRLWADRVWRFFAGSAAIASAAAGLSAARMIGGSEFLFGPYGQALCAFALPAALIGLSAHAAPRAPQTQAALEAVAIALTLGFAAATTRIAFSAGAPLLQPVSFLESGVHEATWLALALVLAVYAERGAADVRRAYAILLAGAAAFASVIGAMLLLTPYWNERPETAVNWALLQHAPLGFALPALAAWAHFAYWRWRGKAEQTAFALGLAGALTAAFVTFEVAHARPVPADGSLDWTVIGAGVLAFAAAAALQCAPGITSGSSSARLDLQPYFKRRRRRARF